MNYTEYVSTMALNLGFPNTTDVNFLAAIPDSIVYAENRITRELDLMAANVRDATSSTAALNRNFNLPTTLGTFLVVDGINVVTPASTAPDSGTRVLLQPASRDYLDYSWPSTEGATVPAFFAYLSQNTASSPSQTQIIFGPWPDAAYRVEVIGKIQPAHLSSTNTTTWVSTNLSECLVALGMVYLNGALLKNFSAQSDDPRSSMSWEAQYQKLLEGAGVYQARARWSGASWTSKPVEPMAQNQRG